MINGNELRLGNLVKYTGKDIAVATTPTAKDIYVRHGQIIEIDAIDSNSVNDNSPYYDIPFSTIEPIPLTPEILESAGFEKDDKFLNAAVWYSKDAVDIKILSRITEVYVGENKIDIEYLHQLQNLYFALTNKELPINLTPHIQESR